MCGLFVFLVLCVLIWRFAKLDSNVLLHFYEKFGQQPSSLKGQTIWITGASSGIGAALAVQLAKCGVKLVLSATRTPNLEQVKQTCLQANGRLSEEDILILPMNITEMSGHKEALDKVIAHFGRLDVLVSNAAVYQVGLFEETDADVDKKTFEVNVFGLINLTREVTRHWLANTQKGHLAVTSSCAGFMAMPSGAAYSGSKFALHGYFEAIRGELGNRGISVSIVCPGLTDTELFTSNHRVTKLEQGTPVTFGISAMTSQRCAKLYSVALANKASYSWVVKHPHLAVIYFEHYLPTLFGAIVPLAFSEKKVRSMANMKY